MSRIKLIKQLKEKNPQLNQLEIKTVIDLFSSGISDALKKGQNVELRELGRWYFKKLKENYNLRNPLNNELIYKPERLKVKFRASKKLKRKINE